MSERSCALLLGMIFLTLGIVGFVPDLVWMPDPAPDAVMPAVGTGPYTAGFGYLFGLFPTNLIHNLVHLSVGLLGIAAASNANGARLFNQFFAIAYLLIALMGLLPLAKTVFGYMPIFGNNVWFNALTGAIAFYFGFLKSKEMGEFSA